MDGSDKKIKAMYSEGHTLTAIAKAVFFSPSGVRKRLARLKVPIITRAARWKRKSRKTRALVRIYAKKGMLQRDIAEACGLSVVTIRKYLKKR